MRYIGGIQDEINYDADGSYNFKGIYCATAAKRIAKDFTDSSSDYAIRYVRATPKMNPMRSRLKRSRHSAIAGPQSITEKTL